MICRMLQSGIADPPELKEGLAKKKESERRFLEQLLDTSKLENYTVPVEINGQLRQYQQVAT